MLTCCFRRSHSHLLFTAPLCTMYDVYSPHKWLASTAWYDQLHTQFTLLYLLTATTYDPKVDDLKNKQVFFYYTITPGCPQLFQLGKFIIVSFFLFKLWVPWIKRSQINSYLSINSQLVCTFFFFLSFFLNSRKNTCPLKLTDGYVCNLRHSVTWLARPNVAII